MPQYCGISENCSLYILVLLGKVSSFKQNVHNSLKKMALAALVCSPEGFSQTYFLKGGCCNPPWIINTEGHITLNLLSVYRYGHPLSIDTKIKY